jgi:DNA-directed RNA polymerase subunit M/transcription elongation factor TFIIS
MAFQNGNHQITCPSCARVHIAYWHRQIVREAYQLFCKACGEVMREGKAIFDYYRVEPVPPPST